MTIEIRQMVIKSNIDNGTANAAGKPGAKASGKNEPCEDCNSNCDGELGGSEERQNLRAMLAMELERVRER